MKVIGILGGLSPESTVYYYEYITRKYSESFGDYSYPKIIIFSVSFQDYVDWQHSGEWEKCEEDMVNSIESLKKAGADFVIIASNTMHYLYEKLSKQADIPVLDLLECVAERTKELGLKKVALLGTKFTMTKDFYRKSLAKHGIQILTPGEDGMKLIHDIIYRELVTGVIRKTSKETYLRVIEKLVKKGAEGVILGCTEIPLLIKQKDVNVLVLDSSQIHADAALNYALE